MNSVMLWLAIRFDDVSRKFLLWALRRDRIACGLPADPEIEACHICDQMRRAIASAERQALAGRHEHDGLQMCTSHRERAAA